MNKQKRTISFAWITTLTLALSLVILIFLEFNQRKALTNWLDTTFQTALEYENNGNVLAAWYGYQIVFDHNPEYSEIQTRIDNTKNAYSNEINGLLNNAIICYSNQVKYCLTSGQSAGSSLETCFSGNGKDCLTVPQSLNIPTSAYSPPPSASFIIPILLTSLATLLSFITVYYLSTTVLKVPRSSQPNILEIMIGSKHSQDLLGELYELSYLSRKTGHKYPGERYLSVIDEFLRRFTSAYKLRPIGEPGQGPIAYSEAKHDADGYINEGEGVYVVNVGWQMDGKPILMPLVSKTKPVQPGVNHE